MANADIRNPIVINATTSTLIASGDFLRSVCFVSLGWTTYKTGEYNQIDSTQIKDILTKSGTELEYRLSGFFAYASNKLAGVIELGEQEIIPAVDNYQNLFAYIGTLGATDSAYNEFLYGKWSKAEEENIFTAYLQTTSFKQEEYEKWLKEQPEGQQDDTFENKKKYAETIEGYPQSYYEYLADNVATFQALKTKANLLEFAKSDKVAGYNDEGYEQYLITKGTYSKDFSKKIALLKDFIDNGNSRNYVYALPKAFYTDKNCSSFTKSYIDSNSKQYFAIEVSAEYATDGIFSTYEGQKSVLAIYDNGAGTSNNTIGAVLGKFASSNFDISASLKASPLNYKTLLGFTFTELGSNIQRSLIQANITYISSKANNTLIMNGRCMDTRPFDYWYQWDLTAFKIETAITQLILNGVNNPNYAIRYNQNGIDTISASIVAQLNTMIDFGCVTEFGATYNSATNELTNIGYIYAMDYYTYIAAMPENYQNEIYGGISFYLRIGRYVRQVVLNITLN